MLVFIEPVTTILKNVIFINAFQRQLISWRQFTLQPMTSHGSSVHETLSTVIARIAFPTGVNVQVITQILLFLELFATYFALKESQRRHALIYVQLIHRRERHLWHRTRLMYISRWLQSCGAFCCKQSLPAYFALPSTITRCQCQYWWQKKTYTGPGLKM